ncbi:PASTA domain-containing protein [Gordonia sp. NPDC003376]
MQTPPKLRTALGVAVAVVLVASGCSNNSTDTSASTTVATDVAHSARATEPSKAVETTTSAPASARTETPVAAAPVSTSVQSEPAVMPYVVCMNLQEAQDAIQSAGVFFSRSRDATGQWRSQILDRNWIVVSQTPSAGSSVTEGQAVLSAVKIGEPNPC